MEYILKSSAVIILFYMSYKLFLEKETYFTYNRVFLILGITLAIIIPFIVIPIYVVEESITFNIAPAQTIGVESLAKENKPFNLISFLSYVYFAGVVAMSLKSLIEFSSLFKILNSSQKEEGKNYTYLKTSKQLSPFSFFNTIVYNPNLFNKTELEHILAHEKVHASQWHSLDVLLVHLTCIIQWFNPFIWLYKKDLQQNLEFLADRSAQSQSDCSKSYQHVLLKTSLNNTQLVLANNFYNSLIKKRIVMLHKNPSNKHRQWKLLLVLPFLAAFMFIFNTKVIAQTKEKEKVVEKTNKEIIQLLITKNSSEKDLEDIKSMFKEHGVTVSFKKVKRNSDHEIIGITINASGKKSNANYSVINETPINTVVISYNKTEDKLAIGNKENVHVWKTKGDNLTITSDDSKKIYEIKSNDSIYVLTSSDGKAHTVKKNVKVIQLNDSKDDIILHEKKGDNVYILKTEKDPDQEEKEVKVIVKSVDDTKWTNDEAEEVIILNSDDNHKVFISEDSESPLFFIDGKEATKEQIEKLDPKDIESIDVFKGDKATEKYGDKAKGGVIKITPKKQ